MADSNLVEYLKQKDETLSRMIRMGDEGAAQKGDTIKKPLIKEK